MYKTIIVYGEVDSQLARRITEACNQEAINSYTLVSLSVINDHDDFCPLTAYLVFVNDRSF